MSCGCCLEACPQYTKIELSQMEDESDEDFAVRKQQAYDTAFVGPHAISQVMLFNQNPTGAALAGERLDDSDRPRRNSDLRQCSKLRRRLPQGNPVDHLHRASRLGHHGLRAEEDLWWLGCRPISCQPLMYQLVPKRWHQRESARSEISWPVSI